MSEFKDVTVIREANVYFDGAVTSRTIIFSTGCKKTLGIMQPGKYSFGTDAPELMEIQSGELEYRVGEEGAWKPVKGGESFEVPGKSRFTMKVATVTDYCCSFLD
jgi:purine/pyrimidine-nucleoside phosphorylase